MKSTGTGAIQTVKDEDKNTRSDVLGTAKEGAANVKESSERWAELRAVTRTACALTNRHG